jgi:HlyD family secretion protein
VLRVLQKSESPVELGAPLVEIGDLASLEVVVDVLTTDAVRVHAGDRARISGWGGDADLDGTVRLVEPRAFTKASALGVDEQRTNVVIDIAAPVEARGKLGDAYRVDVHIIVAMVEDAVIVPIGALFRDPSGWAVFVVEAGHTRRRAVTLARRGTAEAVVAQGLAAAERVILFPGETVADGTWVRAR